MEILFSKTFSSAEVFISFIRTEVLIFQNGKNNMF